MKESLEDKDAELLIKQLEEYKAEGGRKRIRIRGRKRKR